MRTVTLEPITSWARAVLLKYTVGALKIDGFIDSLIVWRQQLIWNWWARCVGVGERFSHLDFSSIKKEQFKTEEQQEYFSWRAASTHNASFSSQGRRRLGCSLSAGVCSPEPAWHTYPLVLWSTKLPACQAQHKCLLHHSPLPHALSAATASEALLQDQSEALVAGTSH